MPFVSFPAVSGSSASEQRRPSQPRPRDFLWQAIPTFGLVMLAFLGGLISAVHDSSPYRVVRDAWTAWAAASELRRLLNDEWPAHLWYAAPVVERGVVHLEPGATYGDYTLYTSLHEAAVSLVDMQGDEVHRWQGPFRDVWSNASVPRWLTNQHILIRRGLAYPDGSLLALYETTFHTPSGCGLAKLDRDGRPIWTYDAAAHHDVCLDERGRIYVLTQRVRPLEECNDVLAALASGPLIEDGVAVLSPSGQELKNISILDALVESPYFRPLMCHVDRRGDITHNNTIQVVGAQFASHHEGVSEGDLIVCLRNLNLVAVINPDRQAIVWATTGPWNQPHDPDPLPNGNILIFDNYLARGNAHGSAVVEFDPRTRQVAWSYGAAAGERLYSEVRACQQSLPNGNVLITDSGSGRIVEVTRGGRLAWEFINPIRGGDHGELIPAVCGARRYTRQELPFADALVRSQPRPHESNEPTELATTID